MKRLHVTLTFDSGTKGVTHVVHDESAGPCFLILPVSRQETTRNVSRADFDETRTPNFGTRNATGEIATPADFQSYLSLIEFLSFVRTDLLLSNVKLSISFQITETYAFLPREAVTRFLLGCTECQRRPRTPSPTNLSNQPQPTSATPLATTTLTSTTTPLSPNALSTTSTTVQSSPKLREGNHGGEGKPLYSYRHQRHQKGSAVPSTTEKTEKEKEEKYNPLSITNLLKKEPVTGSFLPSADSLPDSRRTPESDRASSRSSASSKRKRMLPEGRTPSPQPSQPLPRPWSPGLDPKNTPIDYSLPITTSYLKHQQRLLQQAEKNKAAAIKETELEQKVTVLPADEIVDTVERDRYSPATGLIDTNLNLLATIQHLHCQVMLALTERLRPSITMPSPLVLPTAANVLTNGMMIGPEVSVQTGENRT